jgi:hypothetical protein
LKTLSLILLMSLPCFAYSQAIRPFKLIDIGTGVSFNRVAGDAETYTNTTSYNLSVNYNPDPYLNFITEFSLGELAGGSVETISERQFQNAFKSIAFRGQVQLGYLTTGRQNETLRSLRDLYIGAGIGVIANDIKKINRTSVQASGYTTNGVDNSTEIYFPFRIGYELKIKNSFKDTFCKLDFGYQYNLGMGDNIDGFQAGKLNDNFAQLFVGLKVCAFGRTWGYTY